MNAVTKDDLVRYCEEQIREHTRHVRVFLDLLHAARLLPDSFGQSDDDDE